MGYYYDVMHDDVEQTNIEGSCRCFLYLNLNCVIIEYQDHYKGVYRCNVKYSKILAETILNIIPTKYEIQYIDRRQTSVKILNVNTSEFLNCLDLFLETGFFINHDDYNNNVEITKSILHKSQFHRVIDKLKESRYPEEKKVINTIKDLY